MYHFAVALQFSISYLILVILTRQSTVNDETHDMTPAKMNKDRKFYEFH